MHANEPIPRERLIEDLWGNAAPKTVSAVLSVYLSRLRRLLAEGPGEQFLLAQAAGYVLRVPPDKLDVHRFKTLLERGRRELASAEAERASATLRDALALWRGPPLADLALEPFAQTEIARLEELRLTALEARIEADLLLGGQDSLVAELETLVAAHPFREGLRAQLMLALYRSGRQAEALQTYRRARRTFSEELGIEPGRRLQELEGAILRQDSSLDAPSAGPPRLRDDEGTDNVRKKRRAPTRGALALAAALALVIAASVVAAVRESSGSSSVPVKLVGDSVAVIDPESVAPVEEIPIGGRPSGLAVGEGSIWVANQDDNTLLRIDPRSREIVRTIGLGIRPTNVAVGVGSVWVLSDWALLRVDPGINDVVARIRLPRISELGLPWSHIELGESAIWVCACACGYIRGALAHIDPDMNSIVFMRDGPVGAIEYGEGSVWALAGYELGTIEQIHPRTNAVLKTVARGRLGGTVSDPLQIAAGDGVVWAASKEALWRMDPATSRFTGSVPLSHAPQSVAVGEGAVWVGSYDGTLQRIDPTSQTVATTTQLGVRPVLSSHAIAVGEGSVWVAVTSLAA